jgi:hypothetical protein
MIKVEVILTPAKYASSFVSFPYFDFHLCWNQAVMWNLVMVLLRCNSYAVVNNSELKFKSSSAALILQPSINQFKKTLSEG